MFQRETPRGFWPQVLSVLQHPTALCTGISVVTCPFQRQILNLETIISRFYKKSRLDYQGHV